MVAAIVAVIGFVGYTAVSGGGSSDKTSAQSGRTPTTSVSASASPSSPQGNGAPTRPQPSDTNSAIAAAPPGKVTVKVSAEGGASWIQATDGNGKQLFQSSLKEGQSKTWTDDKKIKLIVGNAGAVQLFVNGKDLGPAGGKGQVVRLTYTPGDPTQG
jgi:cytoskeletal protein RodZ